MKTSRYVGVESLLRNLMLLLLLLGTARTSRSQVQAPSLGSAAGFALFTAVGAVANTGPLSFINGDVGTNVGAISGYLGIVGGTIHLADGLTNQAAKDVLTAYNYVQAIPCPKRAALPPAMGAGQTLPANIYCFGGAASVGGDLYLDGANDPNALFIFKIGGAFSAGAISHIYLIRGAMASNVFWQVDGAASIAAQSQFAGVILANGAIDLSDGVSLNGQALSISGAISTYNNRVTNQQIKRPLPVELTSFTADRQGPDAELSWTTASEKNCAYFTVESSADGSVFTALGRVPGQGTSVLAHTYTWRDPQPDRAATSAVYYRLRVVDTDGTATFSPVRRLSDFPGAGLQLRAYPNPFQQQLSLQITADAGPAVIVQLLDAQGRLLRQRELSAHFGPTVLTLDEAAGRPAGLYFVRIEQGARHQQLTLVHR